MTLLHTASARTSPTNVFAVPPQTIGTHGASPTTLDPYAALSALQALGVPAAMMHARRFDTTHTHDGSRLERALAGARELHQLVEQGLPGAVAGKKRFGVELEFRPTPTAISPTAALESRDHVYAHLETALRTQGYRVELMADPAPTFDMAVGERLYPTIFETYRYGDRCIRVQRFKGHGAVLLTVDAGGDNITKTKLVGIDTVFAAGPQVQDIVRTSFGADGGVTDTIVQDTRYMLITKDVSGDTAKMWVTLRHADNGDLLANVTGENGNFYTPDTAHPLGNPALGGAEKTITVPICTAMEFAESASALDRDAHAAFRLVIPVLERLMSGRVLMQKSDRYTGLRVYGMGGDPNASGVFVVDCEEHPNLELISPILTPRDLPIMDVLVAALGKRGYVGTTRRDAVGVHQHVEMPYTLSVAPALRVARAFVRHQAAFYSVIPVDENRLPYMAPLSPALVARLADPTYGDNSADPATILTVVRDFVEQTDGKYHALNLENHFACLIDALVRSGRLLLNTPFDVSTPDGATYQFRAEINATTNVANVFYAVGAQWKPLVRFPDSARKRMNTFELRFSDTVHQEVAPGHFKIDAASVGYLVRVGLAFGLLYGTQEAAELSINEAGVVPTAAPRGTARHHKRVTLAPLRRSYRRAPAVSRGGAVP